MRQLIATVIVILRLRLCAVSSTFRVYAWCRVFRLCRYLDCTGQPCGSDGPEPGQGPARVCRRAEDQDIDVEEDDVSLEHD